jgi:hypothetical protein
MYLHFFPRVFFVFSCLTMALAVPVTGMAAEWIAQPAITARYEYNDNVNLSILPQSSVRGSFVTPSLDFGVNTAVWQVSGGVSATQRRYSGQAGLDRDDNTSRLSTVYRTERNTWQLTASRRLDSLLGTDLITADTGVAQTQTQTDTRSVAPSWSWMYSERTTLQVMYQLNDVSYDDENTQGGGLFDYDYRSTTVVLSNQMSELNRVFITGGYSTYEVSNTGFDSDTVNVQVGATRIFSSTVQGTLQVGRRKTEAFTREDTGSLYSGNLERQFEKSLARLTVSRTLNPTGSGQSEQDTLGLVLDNPLTPRLIWSVSGNLLKTRYFAGNITGDDLTYYDFNSGLAWQWLRDWNMGLNYRYVHVKRDDEPESADSNSVYLTLTYRPLKLAISR